MKQEREFLFYHADRAHSLQEGQDIALRPDGLSLFGSCYSPFDNEDRGRWSQAKHREFVAEFVRVSNTKFADRPSRLKVIFAALTIDDAITHGRETRDPKSAGGQVVEIYARDFVTLDRNWLDYNSDDAQQVRNAECYWWGEISNHQPRSCDRIAPRLEVLVGLPARVGRVVADF